MESWNLGHEVKHPHTTKPDVTRVSVHSGGRGRKQGPSALFILISEVVPCLLSTTSGVSTRRKNQQAAFQETYGTTPRLGDCAKISTHTKTWLSRHTDDSIISQGETHMSHTWKPMNTPGENYSFAKEITITIDWFRKSIQPTLPLLVSRTSWEINNLMSWWIKLGQGEMGVFI